MKKDTGKSAEIMDGATGTIKIGPSDKSGRDFRAHASIIRNT